MLALQRSAGNSAVVRMLARQAGPGTVAPGDELIDPDDEITFAPPTPEELRAIEARQAERRRPLLEALEHHDSITFLRRLRALDYVERVMLETDGTFMREIQRRLGRSISTWIVRLTLRYGHPYPPAVRALYLAVSMGDAQRVRDLIRSDGPTARAMPGLQEAVALKFGGREAQSIQALLAEAETQRSGGTSQDYTEAHYEEGRVQAFGGRMAFAMARTARELRVIVRIRMRDDPARTAGTSPITDDVLRRWRRSIDSYWNSRFVAVNGMTRLAVVFVPLFVFNENDPAHFSVTVRGGDIRSNVSNWYTGDDDPQLAAHEFGHMIGNPDEYNLPATEAEIPQDVPQYRRTDTVRLTAQERRENTWQGRTGEVRPVNTEGYDMPNVMGSGGQALDRHVWPVIGWYNRNMKPAGEPDFVIRLRQ